MTGKRFVSRFNPGRPAWLEEIIQPLYHRKTMLAAGLVETKFFAAVTLTSTVDITPQLSASNGQIPDPKIFVIHGIRTKFGEAGVPLASLVPDAKVLSDRTAFQLFIGEKFYLHAPTFLVPSGGLGVHAFGATDAATVDRVATTGFGGYWDRFSTMRVPITIPSRQLFYALITPETGGITLTANRDVWVIFDGAFGREVA
jgi:hypothetical protein